MADPTKECLNPCEYDAFNQPVQSILRVVQKDWFTVCELPFSNYLLILNYQINTCLHAQLLRWQKR